MIQIASDIFTATNNVLIKNKLITSGLYVECSDEEREIIKANAQKHSKILDLESEQHDNGGWGRFHTQNTKVKQKCKTTESAAFKLFMYGINRGFGITDKLCVYMERLLGDLSLWPDAWERNKWFNPAVPQFVASKLALFGSDSVAYKKEVSKWLSILAEGFSSGEYSEEKVDTYAKQIFETPIHGSYIGLNSINNVALFGCNISAIPKETQSAYINWLHNSKDKISYSYVSLSEFPDTLTEKNELNDFLNIMQYVSLFHDFNNVFDKEIDWILSKQDEDGFWDFGNAVDYCKLSNQWRGDKDRKIDHTVLALNILHNGNIVPFV